MKRQSKKFARDYLLMYLFLLGITFGFGCRDKSLEGKVQHPSTLKKGEVVKDTGYFRIMYIGNILDMEGADPNDRGKMRIGDIDHDNDLDFCIIDNEGYSFVYENIAPIRPIGADPNAQIVYRNDH